MLYVFILFLYLCDPVFSFEFSNCFNAASETFVVLSFFSLLFLTKIQFYFQQRYYNIHINLTTIQHAKKITKICTNYQEKLTEERFEKELNAILQVILKDDCLVINDAEK